jgi:hypothetical protein
VLLVGTIDHSIVSLAGAETSWCLGVSLSSRSFESGKPLDPCAVRIAERDGRRVMRDHEMRGSTGWRRARGDADDGESTANAVRRFNELLTRHGGRGALFAGVVIGILLIGRGIINF